MQESTTPALELQTGPLPIEQRVLLYDPEGFSHHLMWRRKRLGVLSNGSAAPENAGERDRLAAEVAIISARATLLRGDREAPNPQTIKDRLAQVEAELKALSPHDNLARKGLETRRQLLLERRDQLRKTGPLIRSRDRRVWKKDERHNGQALPLDKWEQLSPRLRSSPDAELREGEEYQWYIGSLSPERLREVRSLSDQMQPLGDGVRAVVCMPAFREGGNIYRTLRNFVGQTNRDGTPLDYSQLRVVVFDNWPASGRRDQTGAEVRRLIEEARRLAPGLQIDYVKGVMDPRAQTIGNIRNIATAAVIDNAARHRKKPSSDLIYVSNDADMPQGALKPTYVADIIHEFDTHPVMDAMAGKIDFPRELMARVPVQFATRRLWQLMDLAHMKKTSREPFLVGRNSAMRLKMVAAVGNYDQNDVAGEDVEIGNKIKWVRSWDPVRRRFERARIKGGENQENNRVRYCGRISVLSDPRRDLVRILGKELIQSQYSAFDRDDSVRGKAGEELTEKAVREGHGGFNRREFERQAAAFYHSALSWRARGGLDAFNTAMRLLGVKYEVIDGNFRITDTSAFEEGMRRVHSVEPRAHTREIANFPDELRTIGSWLGVDITSAQEYKVGTNNRVYSVRTADGRELIVRINNRSGRDKYSAEEWAMDQARRQGIPVPAVVKVESAGSVIKGMCISVIEKAPGEIVRRNITRDSLRQAGRALRKIHAVPVPAGYGFLDGNGRGMSPDWESFITGTMQRDHAQSFVDAGFIDAADIAAALEYVNTNRRLLGSAPQQLLHGDFSLSNMVSQNGRLTGIFDFENAKAGDPLLDLAYFSIFDRPNTGTDGFRELLRGYGRPDLLDDPNARTRFNMYRLSTIFASMQWLATGEISEARGQWLRDQLRETLVDIRSEAQSSSGQPTPEPLRRAERIQTQPLSRGKIDSLLKGRFQRAVDWFRDFYVKGLTREDQEFVTARDRYVEIQDVLHAAVQSGDRASKEALFQVLKRDPNVRLADFELRRHIYRLVVAHRARPQQFREPNLENPAYRFLVYARNRGSLKRYEQEYSLIPDVNFADVVFDIARRRKQQGKIMYILDEGGTFDVALQQAGQVIGMRVPGSRLHLSSIAADDMATRFADCHLIPVEHHMADVHTLTQVLGREKQDLIISEAAYKFFWDPLGAVVQTSNALRNGGWAFIGDIQENVSYSFDNLFLDGDGRPMDPVKFFEYLNTLDLGYRFYPAMHTTTSMGDERRVLTLAIQKSTNTDIQLPVFYGERQIDPGESSWRSPLVYIAPSAGSSKKYGGYTKVA